EGVAGRSGEAGLDADGAGVGEEAVGVLPGVRAVLGGGLERVVAGGGDLLECLVVQDRLGEGGLVAGGGVAAAPVGHAVGVDVLGVGHAEFGGGGVHLGDEGGDAGAVGAGERVGGVGARGEHQGVEHVLD